MNNDFFKWFLLESAFLDGCFADIVNRKVFVLYQCIRRTGMFSKKINQILLTLSKNMKAGPMQEARV